ncbi:MAG: T9SS type A sorting domain-containing protein [bacterium]
MFKKNKWPVGVRLWLGLVFVLLPYSIVHAQTKLECVAITGFGGSAGSSGFQLIAAGGQAGPVGFAASTNYKLDAGFIPCLPNVDSGGSATLTVTPSSRNVPFTSGTTTFAVSISGTGVSSYSATVIDGATWLTITSGGSGGTSGTITANYAANTTSLQRTGKIEVTAPGANGSPQTVTVVQAPVSGTCHLTWQMNISVSDLGAGNETLAIGQGPSATDGLDAACGESELPPPPPSTQFDIRFVLPDSPPKESLKDFRNDADGAVTWDIKLQPGASGSQITFTWNIANLPGGSFVLKDAITGTLVNVDMTAQNSYILMNPNINALKIEHRNEECRNVSVVTGWNIISVPLAATDMSVSTLFPGAASGAFAFNNGYVEATTLETGNGYWLKFNSANTYQVCGSVVAPKEITVNSGWNIIGPFEQDVPTASITSVPAGIVTTAYFGFSNGYQTATTLISGKGYWVKTSQPGRLILPGSGMMGKAGQSPPPPALAEVDPSWPQLSIEDADGKRGVLYLSPCGGTTVASELPPVPPADIYDVRFSSDRLVESACAGSYQISISSAQYPIRIKAQNFNESNLRIRDGITGSLLDEVLPDGEAISIFQALNTLEIAFENASVQTPLQYELEQNYPNPFNPSTRFSFSIPQSEHVRITVHNSLGQIVQVAVDRTMAAGKHKIEVDASGLTSGIYFYRIEAGRFSTLKKMILMK